MRHTGRRLREAPSQGHKIIDTEPWKWVFLPCCALHTSLPHPSACCGGWGTVSGPSPPLTRCQPPCGHAVMEQGENYWGVFGVSPEKAGVACASLAALPSSLLSDIPYGRRLWLAMKYHISYHRSSWASVHIRGKGTFSMPLCVHPHTSTCKCIFLDFSVYSP